jgi:hypothetical protein
MSDKLAMIGGSFLLFAWWPPLLFPLRLFDCLVMIVSKYCYPVPFSSVAAFLASFSVMTSPSYASSSLIAMEMDW